MSSKRRIRSTGSRSRPGGRGCGTVASFANSGTSDIPRGRSSAGSAIDGGRDEEDDESYRYRIHLKLTSQAGSNENAIRFSLLQIPGIQDVVFDRRAGTFTCYVYAISTVAAASLLPG